MRSSSYETGVAFRELLDVLRDADQNFLDGFRAVPDDASAIEGYRFLVDVFSVALDCYVTTDAGDYTNLVHRVQWARARLEAAGTH